MKILFIVTLSLFTFAGYAQTLQDVKRSQANPCVLSAKLVSQNNKKDVKFKTDYGSSIVDKTRQHNYECTVRWMGKTNQALQVEYIFLFSDGGKATPGEVKTHDFTADPSKTETLTLESPKVTQNDTKLVAIDEYSKEGVNIKGLVIRLKKDGEIIKVWSSDGTWTKHAWKKEFNLDDPKKATK